MVVAMAESELLVVLIYIHAYRLCVPEVERSALHQSELAGRKVALVVRRIEPGLYLAEMLLYGNTTIMPGQVEIAVVGRIERRVLVALGDVVYVKLAAVCESVNKSTVKYILNKLGLGKLAYVGIALTQLYSAPYPDATIELDNGKTISLHRYLFLVAMNHRYEGGGFKFCPMANSADGILDMCTVIKRPIPVLLCALVKAYSGKHFSVGGIKPYKSSSFVITSSEPQWVHTDGEVIGKSDKLTITCKKQTLNMMY